MSKFTDQERKEGAWNTAEMIKKLEAALASDLKKYDGSPKVQRSIVTQAETTLKKLYSDLFELLEVDNMKAFEKAMPTTFVLHGEADNNDLVTISSLTKYFRAFMNSVKVSLNNVVEVPEYVLRAASTGSLHMTIEPVGEHKDQGSVALEEIGKAFKRIRDAKISRTDELSPLENAVSKMIPRKRAGLTKVEMIGSAVSKDPIEVVRGEVIVKTKRQTNKMRGNLLPIWGKLVAMDREKRWGVVVSEFRTKFHYDQAFDDEIAKSITSGERTFFLKDDHGKRVLERID